MQDKMNNTGTTERGDEKKKKHGATNKDSRKMSGPTTKTRNPRGYNDRMTFLDLRVAGEGTHVDDGLITVNIYIELRPRDDDAI
jgi:hypothetical protein